MARKITPAEHIENFFRTCTTEEALTQRDRIELILRVREIGGVPAKRGRPRSKRAKGPLAVDREPAA